MVYINMLAGSIGIKSTADQDPVLSNIMLTRFFLKKSPADQDAVFYNRKLTGSFAIKSPVEQKPVLCIDMLARFFWYKVGS